MSVEVRLNFRELERELLSSNGPMAHDLMRRAQRVQNKARRLTPVDQGRLRASIVTEVRGSGSSLTARIGSNLEYAIYVHEGTGVYAGKGYIYPRRGRFLAWRDRGSGQMVFARKVRGIKGRPFLADALDAAT